MAHPKALSITGSMIITGKVNFGAVSPAAFSASLDASSYSLIKNEAVDITPVVVSGGEGTRVYSISRSLPSGLSFNTSTGRITGTPTGVFTNASFTISVVDDLPNSGSQTFTIGVIYLPIFSFKSKNTLLILFILADNDSLATSLASPNSFRSCAPNLGKKSSLIN